MSSPRLNRNKISASELVAKLEQDTNYMARVKQAEKRQQEKAADHNLAASLVIQDLGDSGFSVKSLDELRRSGVQYKAAIPLLLRWLPKVSSLTVKESLVRTLSVPWAKGIAARPLINEFRAAPEDLDAGLKWAIGNALEVVADDAVFQDIAELVRDKRHGKAREMLAASLGNMKNSAAVDVLIELLDDDEVVGHAIMALGRLNAQKARPFIENLLNHSKPWVCKEASKALAKMR